MMGGGSGVGDWRATRGDGGNGEKGAFLCMNGRILERQSVLK